jgi:hypothetical protein
MFDAVCLRNEADETSCFEPHLQSNPLGLTKENLPSERKHLQEKRKVFRKLPMRALD